MHPGVHGACMQGCPGGANGEECEVHGGNAGEVCFGRVHKVFAVCVCVCARVCVCALVSEELVLVPDAPGRYNAAVVLFGPSQLRLMRLSAALRQEHPWKAIFT